MRAKAEAKKKALEEGGGAAQVAPKKDVSKMTLAE